MEIFLTALALVFVVGGILSANLNFRAGEDFTQQEQETDATPIPATPTHTTPYSIFEDRVMEFKYPNSKIVSSSQNSFESESSDAANLITDWYKDKIEGLGMGVRTFVTTETNGNVLNKLAGADARGEVSIEIKKEASEVLVKIVVFVK